MYQGIFNITVNTFRPVGGVVPIDAFFTLDPASSPIFSLVGETIRITRPASDRTPVEIVFKLHNPDLLLLGIAFSNGRPGLGHNEFPVVLLQPEDVPSKGPHGAYRKMTVQDAGKLPAELYRYNFILLLQSLQTGEMGIIDPGIQTDST